MFIVLEINYSSLLCVCVGCGGTEDAFQKPVLCPLQVPETCRLVWQVPLPEELSYFGPQKLQVEKEVKRILKILLMTK